MQPTVIATLLMGTILLALRIENEQWLIWPVVLSFIAIWLRPSSLKDEESKDKSFLDSLPPWMRKSIQMVAPLIIAAVVAAVVAAVISLFGGTSDDNEDEFGYGDPIGIGSGDESQLP